MSPKAANERGLSRRALFGAGLGRLARDRLERLAHLTGEDPSRPAAADPHAEAEALKRDLREAWGAGDPRPFLQRLAPVAERLVIAAGVQRDQRALDIGAGDGNMALALARRGVDTEACDLTPAMVERGRARTDSEGLAVGWHEADVEALPFADGEFDAVLSSFGAIWAPRADRAVAELTRVCRPVGTLRSRRRFPSASSAAPSPSAVRRPAGLQRPSIRSAGAVTRPHTCTFSALRTSKCSTRRYLSSSRTPTSYGASCRRRRAHWAGRDSPNPTASISSAARCSA